LSPHRNSPPFPVPLDPYLRNHGGGT